MSGLGLRGQLVAATFVPLIIFAAAAGGVGAYALTAVPRDLILARQTAVAQVAAAGVASTLRGQIRLLETTAADLADVEDANRARLLAERGRLLTAFNGGVRLLDHENRVLASLPAEPALIGRDQSALAAVQAANRTGGTGVASAFPDPTTGEPAVVVAVPVDASGTDSTTLVGSIALRRTEWARDLNLLRTPSGGVAYLVDSTSTVISHPNVDRIGTRLDVSPDVWPLAVGGQPGSTLSATPDGPLVVAYAPIPGLGWGVIVEEPWATVAATYLPFQWTAAALLASGVILALTALLVSVGRITRPLQSLIVAGERVAAGLPYPPLPLAGPADLRTLTRVINDMVAHLDDQQAALRLYARRLIHGQEEERLRVARDLHDETVQDLIGLIQRLELASAPDVSAAQAQQHLEQANALARAALTDARRIGHNLRPSTLADLGLSAAVRALAQETTAALPSATVRCDVDGPADDLPLEVAVSVFRIVQEALANIRRHAPSATQVDVALVVDERAILVMVEDDGPGFAMPPRAERVRQGHFGLAGITERADLYGGETRVRSEPGEGTTVRVRLPRDTAASGMA